MKTTKWMLIFFMLTTYFAMDAKASNYPEKRKYSMSVEGVYFKMKHNSKLVGLGLNMDWWLSPQISLGGDIIIGSDLDDYTYLCLFPNVSFHLPNRPKNVDVFFGLGVNLIGVIETDEWDSDTIFKLYGFAGARINLSRHFGTIFRLFIGGNIFDGFSFGLMWSK